LRTGETSRLTLLPNRQAWMALTYRNVRSAGEKLLLGFSPTALGNQARDANLMETGHAENGLAYTVIRNPSNGLATLRGAWPGS